MTSNIVAMGLSLNAGITLINQAGIDYKHCTCVVSFAAADDVNANGLAHSHLELHACTIHAEYLVGVRLT